MNDFLRGARIVSPLATLLKNCRVPKVVIDSEIGEVYRVIIEPEAVQQALGVHDKILGVVDVTKVMSDFLVLIVAETIQKRLEDIYEEVNSREVNYS